MHKYVARCTTCKASNLFHVGEISLTIEDLALGVLASAAVGRTLSTSAGIRDGSVLSRSLLAGALLSGTGAARAAGDGSTVADSIVITFAASHC